MPVSLKDQIVVVVGASSGIGRAAAVLMAREGAKVMASARRKDRLDEWQREMAAEGHTVATSVADATDAAQMTALAEATRAKFGPAQILVFATGTNTPERSMKRLSPAVWNELIATNLSGAYYATQAFLPAMREARFGHIIYISSISGHTPDVSGAAYQASKRGMIGLSHAVRLEEKENGIRTTVINPGLVDTEILEKRPVKPSAEMLAQALVPEHVAEVVLAAAKLPPRAVISEMSVVPSAL
ncbi:MAG TPA: SDR family oxidoreductase [Bryobacteraceae bacterium]|nr:SDR family oxidoreductase [Bryobacteraceae bacterium]